MKIKTGHRVTFQKYASAYPLDCLANFMPFLTKKRLRQPSTDNMTRDIPNYHSESGFIFLLRMSLIISTTNKGGEPINRHEESVRLKKSSNISRDGFGILVLELFLAVFYLRTYRSIIIIYAEPGNFRVNDNTKRQKYLDWYPVGFV